MIHTRRTSSHFALSRLACGMGAHWLCLLLLTVGCRTTNMQASKLPDEFRCPPTKNTDVINLARVAGPGANSALIGPGDLLEVTVASGGDDEKPIPSLTRVAENGTVNVPLVGAVAVAGMEAIEAEQNITAAAIQRDVFLHPAVSLEVKKQAVHRVTVIGAVDAPGVHELPRGTSDLLSALAAAGGLTEEAGSEVEVLRHSHMLADSSTAGGNEVQLASYAPGVDSPIGPPAYPTTSPQPMPTQATGPRLERIDLTAAQQTGNAGYRLNDGDVVTVFKRDKRIVHVAGLVNKPGQFEIPDNQDVHLLDAIAMSGGRSSPLADKVLVIRRVPGRTDPVVIEASMSDCKKNGRENIRLAAGDMISVEQTAMTFTVDTMMNFFRVSLGLTNRAAFF